MIAKKESTSFKRPTKKQYPAYALKSDDGKNQIQES